MPAMLEDPATPPIYRRSGEQPYPQPGTLLPDSIQPRAVVLRDRTTKASVIPFSSPSEVPVSLIDHLRKQLNREIEQGDTYPMMDEFTLEAFGAYWFGNFGAVMLLGEVQSQEEVRQMERDGADWEKQCLGSFYIKPNYPGRSSHVCNGGFIVTSVSRSRGVGRLMGECYLEWTPLLGYTYSVFNLVYETNVASCRIWDALGFKRIGRVPGAGNLKSQPEGHFVDAIIYGRHLGYKKEDTDDEKRFERIKYYLKTGKYPGDADSAEKNRLRAAVRNYTLVEGPGEDKLMLGDKEVISEPRMQYEIARMYHRSNNDTHAGINKTTATVSEKYHWNRIKTTVTEVIDNCAECNEKLKKKSQKSAAAAAAAQSSTNRKTSGSEKPTSSPQDATFTPSSAAPTPGSEFVFQHEFAVESASAVPTPQDSSDMQCDVADDNMTIDPNNIAMLSSAVQNLGSNPAADPMHHPPPHSDHLHHLNDSFDPLSDPFHHGVPQNSLATTIDPAGLQHPLSHHPIAQPHHQQYTSPYQPLTSHHDLGPQHHPHLPTSSGYVDNDGALLDGCSSDTRQQYNPA